MEDTEVQNITYIIISLLKNLRQQEVLLGFFFASEQEVVKATVSFVPNIRHTAVQLDNPVFKNTLLHVSQ